MVGARRGDRDLNAPEPAARFGRPTLVVLGLFVVLQVLWFAVLNPAGPRPLQGDEGRYQHEALTIASGIEPAPEFLWPPLQKYFLGGVFALFGAGPLPLALLQTLLLAASGLIFWRLIVFAGFGTIAADVALALYLFDPQITSFAFCLWPEVTFLFLLFSSLGFLFLALSPPLLRIGLGGVFLGLALLAKSVIGPFIPFIALALAFREPGVRPLLRGLRTATLVTGLAIAVLPVVVWNGVHYGSWGIANSAVFNLWVGLDDPRSRTDYDSVVGRAYVEYQAAGRTPAERDRVALTRVKEKFEVEGFAAIVQGQLEKQYGRLFDKNSFFTDQLPGGRFRPQETVPAPAALARAWAWGIYGLTLALAGPGLFLVPWTTMRKSIWLPLLFLIYCVGTLLWLHVKTRYRVAFLPCLDLSAGITVARLFWESKRVMTIFSDAKFFAVRIAAGLTVSTLLLWLAFGSF